MRTKAIAIAAMISMAAATGCKDKGKESAQKAAQDVEAIAALVEKDVAEIERGLPEGGKKLQEALFKGDADPRKDPQVVRKELLRVRREVPDLNIAKSTFFAVADDQGVAIRNDLEPDVMAGTNLVQVFPELGKALKGEPWVVTQGSFPGVTGKDGPDPDWIAAVPLKNEKGAVAGLYVTGWTFRRFAHHLQEVLKSQMQDALRASGDTGKLPVFYVGLFDKDGVYMAPLTPPVNEKELASRDLVGKTAAGPYQGTANITDRDFGFAAKRTPKLGEGRGVVVLRSEL
jgi:hypothetical protein